MKFIKSALFLCSFVGISAFSGAHQNEQNLNRFANWHLECPCKKKDKKVPPAIPAPTPTNCACECPCKKKDKKGPSVFANWILGCPYKNKDKKDNPPSPPPQPKLAHTIFAYANKSQADCPCCPRKKRDRERHDQPKNNPGAQFSLQSLSELINSADKPLLALVQLWTDQVKISESSENPPSESALQLLNLHKKCPKNYYTQCFANLCEELGIGCSETIVYGNKGYDFSYNDQLEYVELFSKQFYLNLDNQTIASSEDIKDDPFLALRTKHHRYAENLDLTESWKKMAYFDLLLSNVDQSIKNQMNQQIESDEMAFETHIACKDCTKVPNRVLVANSTHEFKYCTPYFQLSVDESEKIEKIHWQISSDLNFGFIPSNFEQVQAYSYHIDLPLLTDTFFNAGDRYFFRLRTYSEGQWSEWSSPFDFVVRKPDPISSFEFEKLGDRQYEISWDGDRRDDVEYLIFASNAIDFIPSAYSEIQINELSDNAIVNAEVNDNLVAITNEKKLVVDGSLAYYRVLVRKNNHLSVPSRLIHVYDLDLHQPRNVLQVVEGNTGGKKSAVLKRIDIVSNNYYLDRVHELPGIREEAARWDKGLLRFNAASLRSIETIARSFSQSSYVSEEVWNYIKPFLLPENHPIRGKLDRIFHSARVTMSPQSFKEAGFKNFRPRRASHIMASPHPQLIGYWIKAFPDSEIYIRDEWKRLVHRCIGARAIKKYLTEHNMLANFKVPNKWLYPLPDEPSPPNSQRFYRKNFILIAEDMRIFDQPRNNKLYKKRMNKPLLTAIFNIIKDLGLYDTVYAFNLPYSKDGKLAFIDTEYHHKWPIPWYKMRKYLSHDMQRLWDQLIRNEPKKNG